MACEAISEDEEKVLYDDSRVLLNTNDCGLQLLLDWANRDRGASWERGNQDEAQRALDGSSQVADGKGMEEGHPRDSNHPI